MTLSLSVIAYHATRLSGWVEQEAKLGPLLAGADLALLPEWSGLEAAFLGAEMSGTAAEWCQRSAERADEWEAQLVHLAKVHKTWICGATLPAATDRGLVNRGYIVAPWGEVHYQDKLILTPYEREVLNLVPGAGLTLVDTVFGKFGMLICYDSEFPLLTRALTEAGAEMILVPSVTETPAGQTRVRQSCRARAIENQCLVVQAPLVGDAKGCELIEHSTGRTGVFVPADVGQPSDGILAQGETDKPGALRVDVDLAAVLAVRRDGNVDNFAHWSEQTTLDTRVRQLAL